MDFKWLNSAMYDDTETLRALMADDEENACEEAGFEAADLLLKDIGYPVDDADNSESVKSDVNIGNLQDGPRAVDPTPCLPPLDDYEIDNGPVHTAGMESPSYHHHQQQQQLQQQQQHHRQCEAPDARHAPHQHNPAGKASKALSPLARRFVPTQEIRAMNDETLLSMAGAEHQPQQQQQQQQQRKQAWGGRGEAWGSPVKREAGQEKLLAAAYGGFQRAWSESVRELDESYAREVGMGDDDLWRDCTRLREENQALRLENSRLRCTPTQAAQQQPVHNNANNNNNNQHQHQHQNQHHHQHQGHAMNGVSQTQTAVLLSPLLECALSPVSSPIRVFSTNPSSPMFPQVQILSPHAMSDGVLLSNSSMQASHGAPGAGMTVEEKMEAQIDKAKLKTKLCKYYTNGSQKACPFYGRHGWCAFAHGEEELSPVSLPAASPALPTSPLLLGSEGCFPN